jgi:signal transduction histidine kinase
MNDATVATSRGPRHASRRCAHCRAAARENRHLRAELQTRRQEAGGASARILAAGDAERRRLERDLHDGAQQRLVSIALQLRLIARRAGADPEIADALTAVLAELDASLAELRELARGLHPAVLAARGLPAALAALTARAPLPVDLAVDVEPRPPASVEVAVYYLVCEALTNVAKYAGARTATVAVARLHGRLVVEVADDGAGGADPARGSGLRGLADRVEALGGTLRVTSPPSAGTTLRAEIPSAQ